MASKNEARVTFLAETRDFTAGIKAINASLSTMRSQLKLNSTQMSGSSSDADQLRDRIKLLATEQGSAKEKIELTNHKLQKAISIYGENSIETEKLRKSLIQAKLQERAIGSELDAANSALQGQKSALGQLTSTISRQESQLAGLKREYTNVVLEQGESSSKAEELASSINNLSSELNENKTRLQSAAGAADDLGTGAKKAGDAAESSSGGWTVLKGALSNLISSGIQTLVGKLAGLASAFADLPSSTREYRTEMAKLNTAFKNAGFSAKDATSTYKSLYSVVGETDQATEAANLMANMCQSEGDLTKWTNILTGAFGTYGDSMPIESLMEASAETAKTGTVTGAFADALNWSSDAAKMFSGYMGGDVKTAEDAFNVALSKCSTEQERNALITDTMTKLYGGAADQYKETSASVIAANEANANLEESQARLGETLEPLQTAWTNFKAKALDALRPVLENLAKNVFPSIQDAMSKMDWSAVSSAIGGIASSVADFIGGKIQDAPDIISGIKGNLEDLWNAAKNVASVIGSIITTVIQLAPVLAVVIPVIIAVKLAIGLVNAIMIVNAAIMLANPIVLVVAAIVGLVAAFIALWHNCEGFRNFWIGLWNGIKSVFSIVVSAIQIGISAIAGFFTALFGQIATIVSSIRAAISTAFNAIKTVIATVMGTIKAVVLTIWTGIKTGISTAVNGIRNTVSSVFNNIKAVVSGIWNGIKSVTTSVWNGIKSAITMVVIGIKNKVSSVFNGVKSTVSNIFNGIKSTTVNVWNGIKSAITKPVEAARDAVKSIIAKIRGFFHFSWSLPKLKVPEFSVKPAGWKIGDLLKGSIPHLSVAWNAQGGIMTKPTLFGGGEAGSEAILPLERNTGWMDILSEIVSQRVHEDAAEIDYDKIKGIVSDLIDGCTQSVYFKDREVARMVKEVQ